MINNGRCDIESSRAMISSGNDELHPDCFVDFLSGKKAGSAMMRGREGCDAYRTFELEQL